MGSLIVVGTGIKFLSHLTVEAKANIEQSDLVLYLVNEPMMKEWIKKANPNSQSLDDIYFNHELRIDAYNAITDYILSALQKDLHVCVVLYGHPSVFAKPALDAAIKGKELGYDTKILPGISAEDCLYADLMIDPGSCGCISYEATDFLIHRRALDTSCHLILWQISAIGALGHVSQHNNKTGLKVLTEYLSKHYNSDHQITIYVAAQYPGFESKITRIKLLQLPDADVSFISTLYVPPIRKTNSDAEMLKALGIR